jgi:hypothetical protein
MSRRACFAAVMLGAALAGCDRPSPTAVDDGAPAPNKPLASQEARERSAMDRLARRVARAMDNPEFRTYVKDQLDRSPIREHKLHFQRFLGAPDHRALGYLARLNQETEAAVTSDAQASSALEMYLPVPAHRAAWTGDANILVASAREDGENPVAYDVRGRQQVLSAKTPPSIPVLAIEPVETDFGPDGNTAFQVDPIPPPPPPPPPPPTPPTGLYMTYAHFVQDFEGWFKGSSEYEIHILGQSGTSDSLTDYQCAGGVATGYYRFDQNDLDWSGNVLLFTQAQLNAYKSLHPNQNFRIIALEDDDTGCVIKFDANRFKNLQTVLQSAYPNLTGGKDTVTSGLGKIVKRANALQKILRAAYSFFTTQDDMIGNAIEDVVVGQFYPGANWIVKGENNVTNGWIKLQMR